MKKNECREEFEKWILNIDLNYMTDLNLDNCGYYKNERIHFLWAGWKEAWKFKVSYEEDVLNVNNLTFQINQGDYKMNEKTLGEMIGVLVDNFEITNDVKEKVKMKIKFDFTSTSDTDIKNWLCGNRRIAWQRPARAMSKEELEGLNNTAVIAQNAGQKVKSVKELVSEYVSIGIPENLALMMINEPERFKDVISQVKI